MAAGLERKNSPEFAIIKDCKGCKLLKGQSKTNQNGQINSFHGKQKSLLQTDVFTVNPKVRMGKKKLTIQTPKRIV